MDRNGNDLAEWLKKAKSWKTNREDFDILVRGFDRGNPVRDIIRGKDIVKVIKSL